MHPPSASAPFQSKYLKIFLQEHFHGKPLIVLLLDPEGPGSISERPTGPLDARVNHRRQELEDSNHTYLVQPKT